MASRSRARKEESLGELVRSIIWIGLVVLGLRTFVMEPFNIPSGSLVPTLLVGDYLVISKFSYGFSKFSFPFWHPPFSGRIFGRMPTRGDVVVFRLPRDTDITYIKRVIGLPGDRIQMKEGELYINDKIVERRQIDDVIDEEHGYPVPIRAFIETLPNGVEHEILQGRDDDDINSNHELDNTAVFTVPDDHLFMMGDNRTNSEDSRKPERQNGVGYVPVENVIGPAEFVFYSIRTAAPPDPSAQWSHPFTPGDPVYHQHSWFEFWYWPFEIRYSRLFHVIR